MKTTNNKQIIVEKEYSILLSIVKTTKCIQRDNECDSPQQKDLFLKCWNNLYIKSQIFKHQRLYITAYINRNEQYASLKELYEYPYKDYITKLKLLLSDQDEPLFGIANNYRIPKSCTSLKFNDTFNQTLKIGDIPNSITKLSFHRCFDNGGVPLACNVLPNSIKTLIFDEYGQDLKQNVLPKSCTKLVMGKHYNKTLKPGDIPASVTELELGQFYNKKLSLGSLPSNLNSLIFGREFNQELKPGDIPYSVTRLMFGYLFKQRLEPCIIPNSCKELVFNGDFNYPIMPGDLPNNIEILKFSYYFNRRLEPYSIPSSVKKLIFNHCFNQVIEKDVLKSCTSLKSISFTPNYPHIDRCFIPPSVKVKYRYQDDSENNWCSKTTNK